jgi:hypothetical protein
MLVVPACADCNFRYKADDEYTRATLALDVRAASHRDVIGNVSSLLRSFQYPEGRKFAQYLGRNTNPTSILAASGAPIATMAQDRNRLNATGEHLLRGLYFIEKGRPVRNDATIRIEHTTGLHPEHPAMRTIAEVFYRFPERRDGAVGHAFSYGAAFGDEMSVWVMMLYDYFFWLATIDERDISQRCADTG